MFSQFLQDQVTIIHKDGTKHEGIRATVQRGKVLTDDVSVPILTGETLERLLPSGQRDIFSITDVHLTKGMGGIPDFYEIFVEREGARQSSPNQAGVNIHVSDSPQARVNLNSVDSSRNTITVEVVDIFSQTRELIAASVPEGDVRDRLLSEVDEMETSQRNGDFKTAYKNFVASAADHMTLLVPVIPGLASLL